MHFYNLYILDFILYYIIFWTLIKIIIDYHFISIYQQFLLIFRKNRIFYIILNKKKYTKIIN